MCGILSIYDIIPLESHGMSIFTAMVFVFSGIVATALIKLFRDKFSAQDERIDQHGRCVDEIRDKMADGRVQFAEIKGTIKETRVVVERIDKSVVKIIDSLIKKD